MRLVNPSIDAFVPSRDDFPGPGDREGPQKQRVGPTEHRGVRSDADGEREDGGYGEARVLGQIPAAMVEVLPDSLEEDSHGQPHVGQPVVPAAFSMVRKYPWQPARLAAPHSSSTYQTEEKFRCLWVQANQNRRREIVAEDFAKGLALTRQLHCASLAHANTVPLRGAFYGACDAEKGVLGFVPTRFFQAVRMAPAISRIERGDNMAFIGNREDRGIESRALADRTIAGCPAQVLAMCGIAEIVTDMAAVRAH